MRNSFANYSSKLLKELLEVFRKYFRDRRSGSLRAESSFRRVAGGPLSYIGGRELRREYQNVGEDTVADAEPIRNQYHFTFTQLVIAAVSLSLFDFSD
jgi:hypothetical protein